MTKISSKKKMPPPPTLEELKKGFEEIVFETMADMKEVGVQKWEFDWSKLWSWFEQKYSLAYQKGWDDRWKHEKAEMVKVLDKNLGDLKINSKLT